jgi:hypothetical protein
MKPLILPEEFRDIARLSAEYRSIEDQANHLDLVSGRNQRRPLYTAISNLSDDSLRQLIGWAIFGRDHAGCKNPAEELAACISDAWVTPRDQAISYIMGKPIHEYLRKAEENLLTTKAS